MLGCKLAFSLYNLHLNAELIDTCWDVNKNGGSGINANPFAKETFNLTKQGQLLRENPEAARQMAADAGITI